MHAHFTPGPLVAKARAEYPLQEIHAAGAAVTQGRTDGDDALSPNRHVVQTGFGAMGCERVFFHRVA